MINGWGYTIIEVLDTNYNLVNKYEFDYCGEVGLIEKPLFDTITHRRKLNGKKSVKFKGFKTQYELTWDLSTNTNTEKIIGLINDLLSNDYIYRIQPRSEVLFRKDIVTIDKDGLADLQFQLVNAKDASPGFENVKLVFESEERKEEMIYIKTELLNHTLSMIPIKINYTLPS